MAVKMYLAATISQDPSKARWVWKMVPDAKKDLQDVHRL